MSEPAKPDRPFTLHFSTKDALGNPHGTTYDFSDPHAPVASLLSGQKVMLEKPVGEAGKLITGEIERILRRITA